MKTSNILFTILVGLGLILITAFTLDMSTWGKSNGSASNGESEEPKSIVELPEFSHIKIRDMHNLTLVTATSSSRIERMSIADSVKIPGYFLSGDTLMISPSNMPIDYGRYRIVCSKDIKSITTENSRITLSSFEQDTLMVNLNGSVMRTSDLKSSFGAMSIRANNDSKIEWFSGLITDLTLEMHSSNGSFQLPVHSVKADLTSSYLQLKGADKLTIEKRDNSKLEIWE